MNQLVSQKWFLAKKVLPIVILIIVLKLVFDQLGWEFMSLNPTLTSVLLGNVFLLGFLLAITLSDYKNSERLPLELAASIETLNDEFQLIYKNKKSPVAKEAMSLLSDFITSLILWFHKKEQTKMLMNKISSLNNVFLAFEKLIQTDYIVRLKDEQYIIRRTLLRIRATKEASSTSLLYPLAELPTVVLLIGLLFTKVASPYELLVVAIIAFVMLYMKASIKVLNNPFNEMGGKPVISLKPLYDIQHRIKEELKDTK